MTTRSVVRVRYRFAFATALTFILFGLAPASGYIQAAAAEAQPPGRRVEVAKCATATGTIFRREAEGKPWQVVKEGEALYSGDLLLGLSGAAVDSRGGAVRVTFRTDLSGTLPLPILESVIVLQEAKDADFEFALDRGRVDVANRKKEGAARVRMHVREGLGEATLTSPASRAALAIYGRWPAGVPFTKNPKPEDRPALNLLFLALQGEVVLKVDTRHFAMKAPPGPALIQWDSVTGGDLAAASLDQLPDWAEDSAKPEAVKKKEIQEQFRQLATSKSLAAAVEGFLHSDDPLKRRGALIALGATDDLPRLANALVNAKHPDVLNHGVIVLRHWIGRGPGQDMKLYNALIKDRNFTEVDARTVLQLLHSFGEGELARPELYDSLIDFLEHEKLALRCLAHWHLHRLVPEGQKIGYNPVAPKDAREQAVAQWRKLVPSGKLPPRRSPKGG